MNLQMNGDIGDIIYSMPIMKHWHAQTGEKSNLYIAPASYTRQQLTPDKFQPLVSLLESQPYIQKVAEYKGQESIDGNYWRSTYQPHFNLCAAQLASLQLPFDLALEPWIFVEPKEVAPVVINRTFRYHNRFPKQMITKDAVFIGMPNEHVAFCAEFGNVSYYPTQDLLEAARVIDGCKYFLGNQSACYAICEGLKKESWLEVCLYTPNCVFPRRNAHFEQGFY
jgi:hypothetical protein